MTKKPEKAAARKAEVKIVSGKELLDFDLDLSFNQRHPARSSVAYKQMREQIRTAPEDFLMLNSGVTVANRKYIVDGGHTRLAITDAKNEGDDISKVKVRVEFLDNLSQLDIAHLSIGRNTQVTPNIIGRHELLGNWSTLRSYLKPEYLPLYNFKSHEKPGVKFDAKFLVQLLHAWWPGRDRNDKFITFYASPGKLVQQWKPEKYAPVIPRINDAIEMWSEIAKTIAKRPAKELDRLGIKQPGRTFLPNGETVDVMIPAAYIWVIYYAFGFLLDENAEWKKDPRGVFKKSFEKQWLQLMKDYKSYGQDASKLGKTTEVYKNQQLALGTNAL